MLWHRQSCSRTVFLGLLVGGYLPAMASWSSGSFRYFLPMAHCVHTASNFLWFQAFYQASWELVPRAKHTSEQLSTSYRRDDVPICISTCKSVQTLTKQSCAFCWYFWSTFSDLTSCPEEVTHPSNPYHTDMPQHSFVYCDVVFNWSPGLCMPVRTQSNNFCLPVGRCSWTCAISLKLFSYALALHDTESATVSAGVTTPRSTPAACQTL